MSRLIRSVIDLFGRQDGATAAEYALILAIIGGTIALAAIGLGSSIATSIYGATNTINDCGQGC